MVLVNDAGMGNGQITLKVLAEVYRLGVSLGYFGRDDVIHWADNLIYNMAHPPIELIEVSMTVSALPADIASALSKIKGQTDVGLATKIVLGLLCRALRDSQNFMYMADYLWKLSNVISDNDLEQSVLTEISLIADAYYLAEQNIYGDLDEVHKRISELLEPFCLYATLRDKCNYIE